MLLYDIALHCAASFFLPKMGWKMLREGKYKKSFLKKMGAEFPIIIKKGKPLIWVHAVSYGETKAIFPLVKKLQENFPSAQFLFSSTTETGHAEAMRLFPKENFGEVYHVYLPFDFSYVINPIVERVKPDLVIITETDFWLNFIHAAKKEGACIALANGKLSERSFSRFKMLSCFSKRLFSLFDLLCVQNITYKERFEKLGVAPAKIHVTGNLKLDAPLLKLSIGEKEEWKKRLGISPEALVITAGSTHDPEEQILLDDLFPLWEKYPHLKLILVPRHPERFDRVAALLEEKKISYSRYSGSPDCHARVTLVDAMGQLKNCYAVSDIAFVGGTLTSKVGGHNLIEPSFFGVPVLFGPYTYSQPDFHELLLSYEAGLPYSPFSLAQLIESKAERENLGGNGLRLCQEAAGSCDKTHSYISSLLKNSLS